MKKDIFVLFIAGIVIFCAGAANASCPTSHLVQHDGTGKIGGGAGICPTCNPRYWCLSGGSGNNNGTNVAWWQSFDAARTWYNGDWMNPGVNGCCGMWDGGSFPSKSMMAAIEFNLNEGSISHSAQYEVEACQSPPTTSFLFTRNYDWYFREIPVFRIGTPITTSSNTTTVTLRGWATNPTYAGPAHYWIISGSGPGGTDLALNSSCSPGGTAVCPAPIQGYQIRAIATGCADGTCANKIPNKPTTGIASAWNLTVTNGTINSRVPTFPIFNVQITNPVPPAATRAYLWIATQLIYADGFVSNYVSRNNAAAFRWSATFGAEIYDLAANYINPSDVKIAWKSAAEGNIFGYNIYRSFIPSGTFVRVNARTIPPLGDGTSYTYKDRIITSNPRNVYYKIGVVRGSGNDKDELLADMAVATPPPRNPR